MAAVAITRICLAGAIAVALSVILVAVFLPGAVPSPAAPGAAPPLLRVWDVASYQGPLAGGVNQSVEIPVAPLPMATPDVYMDGSFSMTSWSLYDQGVFHEGGTCDAAFFTAGPCNLFVGIFTPGAWQEYRAGGPLAPIWCFPGGANACGNASGAEVGTPNLSSYDGSGFDIVMWNLANYTLSGSYAFTVYAGGTTS